MFNQIYNEMDNIRPNLYIGSVSAAYDEENLKKLNITHILTIEDNRLDFSVSSKFVCKFVKLADTMYSDIIDVFEECIQFIESAIQNCTGVLIHCFAGISRSATILCAYLMHTEKKPFREILLDVRKTRQINPNFGFSKQLELFELMNFTVDKNSPIFKIFKLERMANFMKLGRSLNSEISASLIDENLTCYKCKKCRNTLFSLNQILPHLKGQEVGKDWKSKLAYYKNLSEANQAGLTGQPDEQCSQVIYLEPLDWFSDKIEELNGRIDCPKCGAKLGSYDWSGSRCSCGTWVTPAFNIALSKIDLFKVEKPIQEPTDEICEETKTENN